MIDLVKNRGEISMINSFTRLGTVLSEIIKIHYSRKLSCNVLCQTIKIDYPRKLSCNILHQIIKISYLRKLACNGLAQIIKIGYPCKLSCNALAQIQHLELPTGFQLPMVLQFATATLRRSCSIGTRHGSPIMFTWLRAPATVRFRFNHKP